MIDKEKLFLLLFEIKKFLLLYLLFRRNKRSQRNRAGQVVKVGYFLI